MKEYNNTPQAELPTRDANKPKAVESIAGRAEKTARALEKGVELGGAAVKEGAKAAKKTTSLLRGAAERLWNNVLDPGIDETKRDREK